MNPRLSRSVRSTSAGLALPLLEVALSSSLMMNTRLDSPAMLNDSIIIPGLALEYILELPVSCSASLKFDLTDFNKLMTEFNKIIGIDKIHCIHVNDSKNVRESHKDRHENIGFGTIGFDTLINIIYDERFKDVPKILETPYIDGEYPPYLQEIDMIRKKTFNSNLIDDII